MIVWVTVVSCFLCVECLVLIRDTQLNECQFKVTNNVFAQINR